MKVEDLQLHIILH